MRLEFLGEWRGQNLDSAPGQPVQLQHALPAWPTICSRLGVQVQQHQALPVRLHQALPVAKPCECDCKRLRQSSLWLT